MFQTHIRKQISGYEIHKYNSMDVSPGSCGNEDTKVVIQQMLLKWIKDWNRKRLSMNPVLNMGAWNMRTMMQKGKLENVKQEMKRNNINILGLSEVRWKDNGDFKSEDIRVIYSGGKSSNIR